jgi:hypothetical protein
MSTARLAPLSTWTGAPQGDEFDARHLSLAMQFQRSHPRADWDEAATFARQNWGKESGADIPITCDEAHQVMSLLQERPSLRLENAIVLAREAGSHASGDFPPNVNVTPQAANPNVQPKTEYPPPIYGSPGAITSDQRQAAANKSQAREAALRRLWELVSNESRAIGAGPRVLARALAAFAESSDWVEALRALDTEESLDKAAEVMQANPTMPWEEVKKRTNYAG